MIFWHFDEFVGPNSTLLTKIDRKVSVFLFHNLQQEVLLAFLELCKIVFLKRLWIFSNFRLTATPGHEPRKDWRGRSAYSVPPDLPQPPRGKTFHSGAADVWCKRFFLNYAVEIRYSIRKITCCFIVMQPRFSFTSIFQWQLVPADEGSAKGAAMIAAVAEKLHL